MEQEQNSTINETTQGPNTSGAKNAGKNAGKKAAKAAKKAGKAAKNAGKVAKGMPSLLAFFATPVGWVVLIIILIIIIIFLVIGIIGFLATAPGIMMEKIANFFKDAIKDIYRDPTASTEIEVSDEAKVDLANYIQELGYDLVGYGFADSENIEKDEDGNVTKVNKSNNNDYLYAYILSNERIYTLHGENDNLGGKVLDVIKTIFVPGYYWNKTIEAFLSGNVSDKAKEGMIEIDWDSAGQKPDDVFDTVELNRDDKTLKIKRWNASLSQGLTNVDNWSWDLEGWSGRYGKPLELSLALHLATMAPDFSYNFCMDEDLQTKVNISLNDIEYNAKYEYVTANNTPVTQDEVEKQYNILSNNRNELKYLEKVEQTNTRELATGGTADINIYPVGIFTNTNVICKTYGDSTHYYRLTNEAGNPVRFFSVDGEILMEDYSISFDNVDEPYFSIIPNDQSPKKLVIQEDYNADPLYYSFKAVNDKIWLYQLSLNEIIDVLSSDTSLYKEEALIYVNAIETLAEKTIDLYIDELIKNPSQTYKRGDKTYKEQFTEAIDVNDYKGTADRLRAIQTNLVEDFPVVVNDYKKQVEEEEEVLKEWGMDFGTLEILYKVFHSVNTSIKTYQPYITSVKNHWYKDIYFVYTKEEGQKLKNISPEDIIYKYGDPSSINNQEFNPEGIASTEEIEKLNGENGQLYVNLTPKSGYKTIEQVGQPGYTDEEPWHWKVKNRLQYGYYFIYDGTEKTASEIKRAKEYLKNDAVNKYDCTDPLLGYNGESESVDVTAINKKAKDINTELKEKGYNVKLKKITFAKKSSLAAFSILESVHTLDAEYVYRDLKEFLIELGYFTKADFESIETNVLDWIIPEYIPTQWPNLKYEKKDTEYCTYIMSAKGLNKEKADNKGTDDNSSSNSNVVNSNETNNTPKSTTDYLFIGDSITVGYSGVTQKTNGRFNSNNNYISGKYTDSSVGDCYFEAEVGATISNWNTNYDALIKNVYQNKDIKGIVVMLGANGLDESGMKTLLQKLTTDFQNVPIYVQATLHFSEKWNGWSTGNNAVEQNKNIDNFNNSIEQYCSNNNISFIDTGSGLYDNDGLLIYTDDGVHLNSNGCAIINANIKSYIGGSTSGNSSSGSQGFQEGLNVVTPGVGKVKSIDKNSITIELSEPDSVKGMSIKIDGFDVDTATISIDDDLEKQSIIGKTTSDNIKIIMRDEKKAIINNVEDYIIVPTSTAQGTNGTSMGEMEDALEFIWRWEGISDADPNDGDYYTVCYPSGDIPTVGHGVTGWTWEIWHELGYNEYISSGNGSSPAVFIKTKIPKNVVDEVSKVIIEREFSNLDNTLASKGITGWGIDQKAAYISLKYNGFASKRANILDAFASGNGAEAKRIWLDCYNRDQYAYGHKRRRATELEIFYEGHYCTTDAEFDAAYNKYYN